VSTIAFPEIGAACEPPEARGHGRDDVALLVARRSDGSLEARRFRELPRLLGAGDLLVVNDSATIPAALAGSLDGEPVIVHLSTPLGGRRWVAEVRGAGLERAEQPEIGARIELPARGRLTIAATHRESARLAEVELELPSAVGQYLSRHGSPIRYAHCPEPWPLAAYQTVFARRPGSAETPSAARPFSRRLVTALVSRGVLVAPLTLHTGVSSLERDEEPYAERYRVPAQTAQLVNAAHGWGGRVVAAGTTVVRALETVCSPDGVAAAASGWTSEVITPQRGLRCVDGLITGWHEPESSHLWMLEAAAGAELLERSYAEAAALGLLGHEFGDSHLVLP
jgi:S-adenosylmethionine:tRNA ribosyltransferase-isomerase